MDIENPSRQRRTKAEIKKLWQAIGDLLEEDHPMTVRQIFYRLRVNSHRADFKLDFKLA
jgi:hypothetical protein